MPRANGRRRDPRQVMSHLTTPWGAAGRERISYNTSYAECTRRHFATIGLRDRRENNNIRSFTTFQVQVIFYSSCPEDTTKSETRPEIPPQPLAAQLYRLQTRTMSCVRYVGEHGLYEFVCKRKRELRAFLRMGGVSSSLV